MAIEIETSTDSVEDVKEAFGSAIEIEESPTEETEEQPKTPVKKTPKAAEPEDEEETGDTEDEDSSDDEGEPEEDAEEEPKPKKQTVPLSELKKERKRRQELERQLAEREDESEGEAEEESTATERPTTFSGKPEPQLETFMAGVDQFDQGAVTKAQNAYLKAIREWDREEARAEAAYNLEVQKAKDQQDELTADFRERRDAFAATEPEYNELVPDSKVMLSRQQELFIYESEMGPQILLYTVKHPKEMTRIAKMGGRSQAAAMLEIEKKVMAEYGTAEADDEEVVTPKAKAVTPPPPKKKSTTPPPPTRLKSAGPGPKSLQELAGPEDRVGVDIEFNPEYERAAKAKRNT